MKNNKLTLLLVAIIALASLVALWQVNSRHQVEQANKELELAVEYTELVTAVGLQGRGQFTVEEVLGELKERNLTSILFKEQTFAELRDLGELQAFRGNELIMDFKGGRSIDWVTELGKNDKLNPLYLYLEIYEEDVFERVKFNLETKTEGVNVFFQPGDGSPGVISTPLTTHELSDIGMGFPKDVIARFAQGELEMNIWLQVRDWPRATPDEIEAVFAEIESLVRVDGILFNDSQLPGFPNHMGFLAGQVSELEVPVAVIEFFDQHGMTSLVNATGKEAVRLHTIPRSELNRMAERRAVQRFDLAVSERNNRLLLLRLYREEAGGEHWLNRNLQYIDSLSERLEQSGYSFGRVQAFESIPFSKVQLLLISIGVMAGGALLLSWWKMPKLGVGLALLGTVAVGLLIFREQIDFVRKLMALASAIIFPTLAVTMFVSGEGEKSILASIKAFLKMSAVSAVGALLLMGILADISYLIKVQQFAGVKLAHIVPLALLAGYLSWKIFKEKKDTPIKFVLRMIDQPLLIGMAFVGVVLAAIAVVYVSRTGNETALVSNLELQFRALLDQILGVRPRTKEFLIGHPLMLLTLYFGYKNKLGVPLVLVGAIGQVSLVNTFAHVHTPVVISLIRAVHGVWIGVALGVILIVVSKIFLEMYRQAIDGGE